MARRLAQQDIGQPFPLIIVENVAHRDRPVPQALYDAFPGAQVVYHDAEESAALKDHGVALCTSEWVAVLEADSTPEPGWLLSLLEAAAKHPQFQVFSGRTHYGAESSWQRALNLLDRSFDDPGHSRSTQHISNNGALYRTAVLRSFPYPSAASPFLSARLRNERILAGGHGAYFERAALTRHAIGGLGFVFEFRRHTGYSDLLMQGPPTLGKIPVCLGRRMRGELGHIVRVHRQYLRWYDWPLVMGLFAFARVPETLGMLTALRNRRFARTDYR